MQKNADVDSGDKEATQQYQKQLQQQLTEQVTKRVKKRPDNTYYWVILAQQATANGDLQAYQQSLSTGAQSDAQ